MFIKSIQVQGFKTYEDTYVALNPKHNVFVGRNGSGKSNFFEAVRFVFGDDIDQLRSGDSRQSLLHQGKSDTNVNASVTIILDNSDQRIPNTDSNEIKLMRMVGLKKDEYFINSRRATKQEVNQMLEMAGLSSSNPYYVVAQGKVTKLADMGDDERLQLLQDVAGTRVYEARRAESVRILSESKAKSEAIRGLMDSIDERMGELSAESAELDEYNGAERKRRAVEYVLYTGELEKASHALQELEEGQGGAAGGAGTGQCRVEADAAAQAATTTSQALGERKGELARANAEATSARKALPKVQEKRVKLAERVSNLRAGVAADQLGAAEAERELGRVQAEVEEKRREVASVEPAFRTAQAALDASRMAAAAVEQRMNTLSDKAGRLGKFRTKGERDSVLDGALKQQRGERSAAVVAAEGVDKEARANGDRERKAASEAGALEKSAAERAAAGTKLGAGLDGLVAQRSSAVSRAHAAKAHLDDCDKRVTELASRLTTAEAAVYAGMPYALRKGLEEVRRLSDPASSSYIAGIKGPLCELIQPTHERYIIPIEAVAGSELFNVVVEDEQVAAKIVAHLNKTKAGRVTCIPLSKIKVQAQAYPTSDDCRPLVNSIVFDPAYDKAIKQQFGRVLLCKNGEVAAKYAREQGFICVTLEGDTANRSGALTGGFINFAETRLKNVRTRKEVTAAAEEASGERAAIEKEVQAAETEVKQHGEAVADAEERVRKSREDSLRLSQEAQRKRREAETAGGKAGQAAREAVRLREQVALFDTRIDDLEKEKASELTTKLSAAEQASLEQLTGDVEEAKKALAAATAAYEAKRSVKQALATQLEDNLLKRVTELQKRISKGSSSTATDTTDELRDLEQQLQTAKAAEGELKVSLDGLQKRVAAKEAEIAHLQDEFNTNNAKAITLTDALRDAELQDEKYLEKRRAVLTRKEEASNKLRDLGTLPTNELHKYAKLKRKALVEELGKAHERLRNLQHVNKRSSAELESFTKQREELQSRYDELLKGDTTIHELIDSLDAKKDDKILVTFKGVQKHFQEIFGDLVPRGSASMTLRTTGDGDDEDKPGAKPKRGDVRMERFTGVAIKASFSDAPQVVTKVLSGGQRVILAVALIFAIQRADPAPFYILDEVDAALDPTHRSTVGAMIRKQTNENGVQFITSSFGEELLEYGDKWFGVSLSHQISEIEELNQQEAVAFVVAARNADSGKQDTASSAKRPKLASSGVSDRSTPSSGPRSRA